MPNKPIILSIALVLLTISSCYYPIEPALLVDHYPVNAGNTWNYTREFSIHNFRPAQPGATFQETTYVRSTTVEAIGREVLQDSIVTWKFRTREAALFWDGSTLATGYQFYRQTRDALTTVAYKNPSLAAPSQDGSPLYRYAGHSFASISELVNSVEDGLRSVFGGMDDSLTYEVGPVTSFLLPIRVGVEWDYRTPLPPLGWRIHKKVVGSTIVHLPSGDYSSYKIQWFWDTNNSGMWNPKMSGYDYVSSRGLLRREFLIKDIVVSSPTSPDSVGLVDVRDESSAVSISVHE